MNVFLANQTTQLAIPMLASNGEAIADATSATYRLTDAVGNLLAEAAATLTLGVSTAVVEIDDAHNTLDAGEVRGFRQIELRVEWSGGVAIVYDEYILESADVLVVLKNSFQTYPEAVMLSSETTGLDAFMSLPRRERIVGLITAWNTLSRLAFQVGRHQVNFNTMTLDQMQRLPDDFLRAVKTAQVLEAAEALDQFSISKKRQSGLMSETIGESSMMFRPEKVLSVPVTRRSLDLLRPYLIWEMGLARA